ncbi:hypothetical protein L1281_000635 [Neisseria sp. HSC-16F19]|nr:hypothetical protein [Neisseria sp. HSC-16F19]MCP2040055.1 hypothetical protein [Neisseria sp. HSC-16F19]
MQTLIEQFAAQTVLMRGLADRLGYPNFAHMMTNTLSSLHDTHLSERERLQRAYDASRIFGGMGSWNDSVPVTAFEMGISDEFDQTTERFWAVRTAVRVALERRI